MSVHDDRRQRRERTFVTTAFLVAMFLMALGLAAIIAEAVRRVIGQ